MLRFFLKNILKKILKIFIPKIILKKRRNYLSNQIKIKYKKLTIKEVFNNIYHSAEWGKSKNSEQKFFSGEGSGNISIVSKYIDGVNIFLESSKALLLEL